MTATLELVAIPTGSPPLDGILYEPAGGETAGAVLLMHGNTMNFYFGAPRFLPPYLIRLGFACLAYNRRGHDVLSTRSSRSLEGGAYQRVTEAIEDNRLAAEFLRDRGFAAPIVIGHSNGGMLGALYVADHPETPALVLLSAHAGGTKAVLLASKNGLLAGDRFDEMSSQARELVAGGNGDTLMLMPGWWHAISAASFVDLVAEMPDLVQTAEAISCPTLFIRGELESEVLYPTTDFARRVRGRCEVRVVRGGDHFYSGVEDDTARIVCDWLPEVLDLQPDRGEGAVWPDAAASTRV